MNARMGAFVGISWIGFASAAMAQQQASSFFTGVPASQVANVPVDTSNAIGTTHGFAAMTNRFNFTSLFSRSIIPSAQPIIGSSNLPSPSSSPSAKYTPNQMVTQPPFLIKWMFGPSNKPPQAAMPYTPTNGVLPVGPQ